MSADLRPRNGRPRPSGAGRHAIAPVRPTIAFAAGFVWILSVILLVLAFWDVIRWWATWLFVAGVVVVLYAAGLVGGQ